jgi:hypothetical protein
MAAPPTRDDRLDQILEPLRFENERVTLANSRSKPFGRIGARRRAERQYANGENT